MSEAKIREYTVALGEVDGDWTPGPDGREVKVMRDPRSGDPCWRVRNVACMAPLDQSIAGLRLVADPTRDLWHVVTVEPPPVGCKVRNLSGRVLGLDAWVFPWAMGSDPANWREYTHLVHAGPVPRHAPAKEHRWERVTPDWAYASDYVCTCGACRVGRQTAADALRMSNTLSADCREALAVLSQAEEQAKAKPAAVTATPEPTKHWWCGTSESNGYRCACGAEFWVDDNDVIMSPDCADAFRQFRKRAADAWAGELRRRVNDPACVAAVRRELAEPDRRRVVVDWHPLDDIEVATSPLDELIDKFSLSRGR